MFRTIAVIASAALSLSFLTNAAEAAQHPRAAFQPAAFAATTGSTSVPIGWHIFCKEHQTECHAPTPGVQQMTLTNETWKTLLEIDQLVNQNIAGISDEDHYHIAPRASPTGGPIPMTAWAIATITRS